MLELLKNMFSICQNIICNVSVIFFLLNDSVWNTNKLSSAADNTTRQYFKHRSTIHAGDKVEMFVEKSLIFYSKT